jgi:hypothetical protein
MTDAPRCSCGYEATDQESVADHLGEQFISGNDTAPDGQLHAEAPRDESSTGWTCLCGFTASDFAVLDAHLLAAFTPPDSIGADGRAHIAVEDQP